MQGAVAPAVTIPAQLPGTFGSYWQRRGGMRPSATVGAEPIREAEIVVVGGGLAGLATALAIKDMRPSADVAVLEAETIGFGASGRNGGLVSPLAAPIWLLTARDRNEHAWALTHLHHAAAAFAHALPQRIPGADARPETLRLDAGGPLTGHGLEAVARRLDGLGIAHALGSAARRGAVSLDVPAHALDPYGLVLGLASEARARGIAIHEGVRVGSIEDAGAGARVVLAEAVPAATRTGARQPSGVVSARRVVVATNADTGAIALPRQPAAHVVWNYMLATDEMDDARLAALGRDGVFTVEINRAYVFWRRHGRRVVFGGIDRLRHKLGEFDVPADVRGRMDRLMRASFGEPALPAAMGWAGRYHATRTELPVLGPAPGLAATVLNVGYGGTGVALTQILAPVAAALALGIPCPDRDAARLHAAIEATRLPIAAGLAFGAGVAFAAAGTTLRRLAPPTRG